MTKQSNTVLKFRARAGIYSNSTGSLTFEPNTITAHSYRWWKFVAVVEGKVVFNNYRYSVSTSKHQGLVRRLLEQLGIKIDLELPLPQGINSDSLATLIETAEEHLCDQFLSEESKRMDRNEKARKNRIKAKLTDYLENKCAFRDYEIKDSDRFGHYNKVAVHQMIEPNSIESDVQNALHSFNRDGFGSVVFYV